MNSRMESILGALKAHPVLTEFVLVPLLLALSIIMLAEIIRVCKLMELGKAHKIRVIGTIVLSGINFVVTAILSVFISYVLTGEFGLLNAFAAFVVPLSFGYMLSIFAIRCIYKKS